MTEKSWGHNLTLSKELQVSKVYANGRNISAKERRLMRDLKELGCRCRLPAVRIEPFLQCQLCFNPRPKIEGDGE